MTDIEKNIAKSLSEKDLQTRIGRGDQTAFAEMVRLYWNTIYSHALAYLKSVPRAEEATQDIFMKVWTSRGKLADIHSLDNYLFIIARNHLYNELRKKMTLVYGHVEERLETTALPDLQTEYKESYQRLLKGIELLPEKRKVVFKMSRLEGLSNEQIASELGINKDTVYQYLVKALIFLRSYMEEHIGNTFLLFFFASLLFLN